jgi:protein-tyrosine-phosphatase
VVYGVLFVCTENAKRSQMAEAFSRVYAAGIFLAERAGSAPSGRVNPLAIEVMRERGCALSAHVPKSLEDISSGPGVEAADRKRA